MSPRSISVIRTTVQSTAHGTDVLTPSDALAVRWCTEMAAGRRDALGELYDCCYPTVEREAARALGHRNDMVADAVQDAWIRVAKRPVMCQSAAELSAWLRRVAMSAAIDLLRAELARRAREERSARTRPEAQSFVADAAQLDSARNMLENLPAPDRALLELRARTGATLVQLAAALGMGPSAVDSRVRRALERARKIAQEYPS